MSEENKKSYNINDEELGNINGGVSIGSNKYHEGQRFREEYGKGFYNIYEILYPYIDKNTYKYKVKLDLYDKNGTRIGNTDVLDEYVDIEAWLEAGILKQIR